jgi:hypothetical protein
MRHDQVVAKISGALKTTCEKLIGVGYSYQKGQKIE